jgi:hypothetical protein
MPNPTLNRTRRLARTLCGMKTFDPRPAQRDLVHRFIDWEVVERRLQQFPAIGRAFPVEHLKSCQETPPFYCHYMGWRLGTWGNDSLFARLEELLTEAEKLPRWSAERNLLKSADFSDFWSLVWQLQVAEFLCQVGSGVQWASSGPDLSVQVESETWYIECYTYRKSFGLMLFIEELLQQVDVGIRVDYDLCMPFSLAKDGDRSSFLDSKLSGFANPTYIDRVRSMARLEYPVLLVPKDKNGLVVYMEGPNPERYVPGVVPSPTGNPETFLKIALNEAIRAKQNANSLGTRRPNLLAVNLSLSADAQFAINSARDLKTSIVEPDLRPNLDALSVSTVGINERLDRSRFMRIAPAATQSLALKRLTYAA